MNDDIRKIIKKIKIHTKRVMHSSLSGDYLSAFKGSGLEFDQIREYTPGDDVRFIDWNSSAKTNKIMVKEFIEERDRTIILLIDVSSSHNFSSQDELKKEMVASIAASLSYIAEFNKDKVGALFFSDTVEKWMPPSRGSAHIHAILQTLFTIKPTSTKTNIAQALRFLINLKKRNAVVFCVSDWIDEIENYSSLLKVASHKYDFVGVRITDPIERCMPDLGLIDLRDSETGNAVVLDTSKGMGLSGQDLDLILEKRLVEQKKLFDRYKVDLLDLTVGEPFVHPMISFFHSRIRRQI